MEDLRHDAAQDQSGRKGFEEKEANVDAEGDLKQAMIADESNIQVTSMVPHQLRQPYAASTEGYRFRQLSA